MTAQQSRRITRVLSPPRTPEELAEIIWRAWGVCIPDVQVCPHHSTPWRAFCDAYFAKRPGSVWVGSRGLGGKTYLLSLLAATKAVLMGANVSVLGGSGGQSANALEYIKRFLTHENIRASVNARNVKYESRLASGALIRALMASGTSVRGGHPDILELDEVDEMDRAIYIAALGQTQSTRMAPHVVASSTHHYPHGTMTYALQHAKEKGWPIHHWCYRESAAGARAWLTKKMIDDKRDTMTSEAWRIEVVLQQPTAEDRAILPEAVQRMFSHALGSLPAANDTHMRAYELEPPQAGARYASGADWGKEQHYSVFITLRTDCKPMKIVAYRRMRRVEWPIILRAFAEQIQRYKGTAAHDSTGIGGPLDDILREAKVAAEGVTMNGAPRTELFTEYIIGIEGGEIIAPYIERVAMDHLYCSTHDLFGRGHQSAGGTDGGSDALAQGRRRRGHPPDSVVACAMAYRSARHRRREAKPVNVLYGSLTPSSPWG